MIPIGEWTSTKIFNYVHGNHLVYNTCWEDPRLDREVMELGPTDHIVLITSAGCNALDYALDEPARIHAVDMNYRQNALLELKIAGIRHLDFEDFFDLFGRGIHPRFESLYRGALRPGLTPQARGYWDRRTHYFRPPNPRHTFYHFGTSGYFARAIVKYLELTRVYSDALRVFEAGSIAEQADIYHRHIKGRFWNRAIKLALRTDLSLSLLGVPRPQREYLEKTCCRSIADFMEDCVEAVFARLSLADNYFWRLYIFGAYTPDCCPEYLKPENFQRLKQGLVDRIEMHTDTLTGFLTKHEEPISRFVLLDHMDWLSNKHPELLALEWQSIMDRSSPSARYLWRSAGFHVDFVDPIRVNFHGSPAQVGELLRYDRETAAACHQRDRVHTYGSFHIAHLAA